MKEKILQLQQEINQLTASSLEEVENLRIKYLSKKGKISLLFDEFRNVPPAEKREIGQLLNQLKESAQSKINELKESLIISADEQQNIDLTRNADPIQIGTRHPLSIIRNEIINIFGHIGFTIAEGPEIEDDWHVFESLNFPAEHPARDMQDTFFIEKNPDVLLRTHTSSVQT
ncbi:MAG TPA: phenylalanine--tRNA ligase subunit alpha, partial [Paludibacteraceae bacterium]|nr:phenylalanine--tRNA ligase subunit alpha [Paludibacteraceae bacterium]